jgi:membrane protein required for colicin V production
MNVLDYLLCAVALGSVIGGIRRGFSRTVVGMGSLVVAIFGAIWLYGTGASFFLEYVSHPAIAGMLGFGTVFCLIMAIGSGVGWILERTLRAAGLGWLDRFLGACIGFVQGLLMSIVIVMALTAFTRNPPPKMIVESSLAPYVLGAADVLTAIAPRDLRDRFDAGYAEVKKSWKKISAEGIRKLPGEAF